MGTLFLVATPIGNLEDITHRAVRVLQEVDLIAAEDTRQARKLLDRYQVDTPLTSYHEHNKETKIPRLLEALAAGDLAVVSDSGTPALNDPGFELVRAAVRAGHRVSPIPGPSAPVAALVASGLPTDTFLYLGYLPRRSTDRRKHLKDIAGQPYTLIFLETPHRILAALEDLEAELGDRQVAIGRELTKLHEEIFRGTLAEARAHYAETSPRGEFTLVVAGAAQEEGRWTEAQLQGALAASDDPPSQLARRLSAESGWPRKEIYQRILEARKA